MGAWQPHYECIQGVHYHRCQFRLDPDFVEEVNDMCRSIAYHVCATENFIGPFDVIHAHDWLTSNAMIYIKQGRGRKMGRNGRVAVESGFTWDAIAGHVAHVYNQ